MTERRYKDKSSWISKLEVQVGSMPFNIDKELFAAKSAKVAALLRENSNEGLSNLLRDMPVDKETFELVARFCYGFEVKMSAENIVQLICLSFYLEMDEKHCNNNLLSKCITFFEERVLPSWNEIIKALRASEKILHQTMQMGLFDAFLQAMIEKVSDNPRMLGESMKISDSEDDTEGVDDESYKPNPRRRLFSVEWQEDLTTLPIQLYHPIIYGMNQHEIKPECISASIYQYANKWIFSCNNGGEAIPIYKRRSQRNIIETLESLLPHGRDLLPCTLLFEMLRSAIELEASSACRNGFEIRIGKQLDQATVKDLLIPSQGYAKELQYDIECIKRIMKIFYDHHVSSSSVSGFITVAELIEEFLAEIACDIDLRRDTFIELAQIAMTAAITHRNCDGIYRAIDMYLDKHASLTEKEKEQVCKVLDFQKMSPEACEHAARNERLPVRVTVQVLFMAQLQLRDTFTKEVQCCDDRLQKEEEDEEEQEEAKVSFKEDELMRMEMEKMRMKVKELEKECYLMKKEIESGHSRERVKKGKVSMWAEMKRKFGCMTSMNDLHCQVKKKKVHPKSGI